MYQNRYDLSLLRHLFRQRSHKQIGNFRLEIKEDLVTVPKKEANFISSGLTRRLEYDRRLKNDFRSVN